MKNEKTKKEDGRIKRMERSVKCLGKLGKCEKEVIKCESEVVREDLVNQGYSVLSEILEKGLKTGSAKEVKRNGKSIKAIV